MKLEIEGTEEEVERLIKKLSKGEIEQETRGEQEQNEVEDREKPFIPHHKRVKRTRKEKWWTNAEVARLKELYQTRRSVKSIAKELHRTVPSVYFKASEIGVHKDSNPVQLPAMVDRLRLLLEPVKHEPPMLKKHAVVPFQKEDFVKKIVSETKIGVKGGKPQSKLLEHEFPDLDGVTVSKEIVKSMFKLFCLGDRVREMNYNNDAYALGIESVAIWNRFASDVMMKSAYICASVKAPNKLAVIRNGTNLVLKYG